MTAAHVGFFSDQTVHLLQFMPQYVEVPPNIEAKRTSSYFSTVLSRWYNNLLLKNESGRLSFLRRLAGHLHLHIHDPDRLTQIQSIEEAGPVLGTREDERTNAAPKCKRITDGNQKEEQKNEKIPTGTLLFSLHPSNRGTPRGTRMRRGAFRVLRR